MLFRSDRAILEGVKLLSLGVLNGWGRITTEANLQELLDSIKDTKIACYLTHNSEESIGKIIGEFINHRYSNNRKAIISDLVLSDIAKEINIKDCKLNAYDYISKAYTENIAGVAVSIEFEEEENYTPFYIGEYETYKIAHCRGCAITERPASNNTLYSAKVNNKLSQKTQGEEIMTKFEISNLIQKLASKLAESTNDEIDVKEILDLIKEEVKEEVVEEVKEEKQLELPITFEAKKEECLEEEKEVKEYETPAEPATPAEPVVEVVAEVVEPVAPVKEEDDDDKPLTIKEFKALIKNTNYSANMPLHSNKVKDTRPMHIRVTEYAQKHKIPEYKAFGIIKKLDSNNK